MIIGVSFLVLAACAYWTVIPPSYRSLFLLICSLSAICAIGPLYAVYYAVMCAAVYAVCSRMSSRPVERRKPYLATAVFILVANLCFYKVFGSRMVYLNSGLFPEWSGPLYGLPRVILPIGLSFVTFRLIHYAVETYRDAVPFTGFVRFASYVLFFPTFLAGPVERFPNFDSQAASMSGFTLKEANYGLWRIMRGVVRKFMIADALAAVIMPMLQEPTAFPKYAVIMSIYGAAIWLYMDFGGYTDMAIGVSHLFGYSVIENFNMPFFKKNIALFWRSWHISVYSWIRDYFFFPFFARGGKAKLYAGVFLTMLVFMLWHAPTLNFLVAGVYNGIGLIVWMIFRDVREKNRVVSRITSMKGMDIAATLLTFSYASFGIGIAFGGRGVAFFSSMAKALF